MKSLSPGTSNFSKSELKEIPTMNHQLLKLYVQMKTLLACEEGQDLVEYALVVALIAFGAITGMGFLATGINNAFSGISTTLTANV
jgi:pilus assembly protein Flp/PilA